MDDALGDLELVEGSDGRTVFKLVSPDDGQRILDAARAAGSVTQYAEP
jgi:hypothetical protein